MKRNNRKKEIIKSPVLFLGFLVFLLLLIFVATKIVISFKNAPIREFSRTSFVLIDRKGEFIIFSLEKKLGQIYFLPSEEVIVSRGFGKYEWRKVFGLGELEKKGGQLVSETIQKNLSVAIFGYFYDENKEIDFYRKDSTMLFQKVFWQALNGKIKTNLEKLDLFLLYLRALNINKNLLKLNDNYSDQKIFSDSKIGQESLALEVLNATSHNGLAQETTNFLEKSGGRVVRNVDALEQQENCEIKAGEDFGESYTLLWIKRFFPCRITFNKNGSRADISIILGEDYWKNQVDKW